MTDSGLPVPCETTDARAAQVTSGSEKPLCVPASACAQPRSSKAGGLRSSSICTGSDTDQGQRKSLNVSFDGGSQVVEITSKAEESRSQSRSLLGDGASGVCGVNTAEARLSQAEAGILELVSTQRKSSMLVEVLLHQVAERDRAESNFAIGDADELLGSKKQAAGPRKSLHEWYKELTVNLAMGRSDSDEEPDTKGNMRQPEVSFWLVQRQGQLIIK